MGEAVNGFADLQIDETILDMVKESVLINCCLWEGVKWYFHVLKSFHGCAKVAVFYIEAQIACISRTDVRSAVCVVSSPG